MRQAGCEPVEIMASRPRDVLRHLPQDPHLWELAAGTMATAGHSPAQVAAHLVAHAPTPDAFAAGLATLATDPVEGLGLAARYQASPEHLAAASERYGLSPADTATVLADTGTTAELLVETLWHRCDHDPDATHQLAVDAGQLDERTVGHALRAAGIITGPDIGEGLASPPTPGRVFDLNDAESLLATLPDPVPSPHTLDPARLEDLAEPRPLSGRHLSGAQP